MNEHSFIINGIEKCQGKLKRFLRMNNWQISNKKRGLRLERMYIAGIFAPEIFIQRNESAFIFFEYNGDIRSIGLKEFF
jgi:hypothetical protein